MEIQIPSGTIIPDKLYFKIGEVTLITDLSAYVLRFWESEFSVISPKRTESGQRLYRKTDIEYILKIKHLLYDKKFTIQGAKNFLKAAKKQKNQPTPQTAINEIKTELQQIRDILD